MRMAFMIGVLATCCLFVHSISAQNKAKQKDLATRVETAGTIVCIGCTLEKESGADPQCTLHSKHAQGLRAEDGKIWTFVDNVKGHLVMTNPKLRDKSVKILGWNYPKAQYIEVFKYQVKEGDKWVAIDYCKTCGFEPGDHKDKDVCEDCEEK